MTDDEVLLHQAQRLSRYIGGLLVGAAPMVQAAVLAEQTAIWLHGYRTDNPETTLTRRAEILSLHCAAVRKLVRLLDEEESA